MKFQALEYDDDWAYGLADFMEIPISNLWYAVDMERINPDDRVYIVKDSNNNYEILLDGRFEAKYSWVTIPVSGVFQYVNRI